MLKASDNPANGPWWVKVQPVKSRSTAILDKLHVWGVVEEESNIWHCSLHHSTNDRKVKAHCTNTVAAYSPLWLLWWQGQMAVPCGGGREREGERATITFHAVNFCYHSSNCFLFAVSCVWNHENSISNDSNNNVFVRQCRNLISSARRRTLVCLLRWFRVVCGETGEHLGHGSSTPDGDGGGGDGWAITARPHGHRWDELQLRQKILPLPGFSCWWSCSRWRSWWCLGVRTPAYSLFFVPVMVEIHVCMLYVGADISSP